MNNQWIKTSDRAPTEQDLPVWGWHKEMMMPMTFTYIPGTLITHWRPAKADIPEPPNEETQWEKDRTAWESWFNAPDCNGATVTAWHAALAYEREQVAKMLAPIATSFLDMHSCGIIEAIRARCEGRGQ
jgi:hypothetical protein